MLFLSFLNCPSVTWPWYPATRPASGNTACALPSQRSFCQGHETRNMILYKLFSAFCGTFFNAIPREAPSLRHRVLLQCTSRTVPLAWLDNRQYSHTKNNSKLIRGFWAYQYQKQIVLYVSKSQQYKIVFPITFLIIITINNKAIVPIVILFAAFLSILTSRCPGVELP